MFTKKITRGEFLKIGFLGMLVVLALPLLKILRQRKNISHKNARYYKNLAG